jgi:hypothetical protein
MSGKRILYSFAMSDPSCLSIPTSPVDDWPSVESILQSVAEELADESPTSQTPQTPRSEPEPHYLDDMFGLSTFFKALGSPFS